MDREQGTRRISDRIRERLTYANAMATIAVFISLGGGAYALTRGEVKSKHIAKSAVKSKHVKDSTLRVGDLSNDTVDQLKGAQGPQGPPGPATGAAGGDLTGSYPNPAIAPGAVGSAEVLDGSLSGDDIDEASLQGGDAAELDGLPRGDYVFRSFTSSPASQENFMAFYAYTMATPDPGTQYVVGQLTLRPTAVAQEFQVCGATGLSGPVQYVRYIEGARTEDSVPGDDCDAAVNFGDTCDFEIVAAQGARVFGAPTLPAGNSCRLLVLQAA